MQKYDYPLHQATALRDFMLPMMALDPDDRPSAGELSRHPWLDMEDAAPPYAVGMAMMTTSAESAAPLPFEREQSKVTAPIRMEAFVECAS
jgi:serine/threonine protein kinase